YTEKRREYAQREIPEYWIVDPIAKVVMVLSLTGDTYRESVFSGAEPLVSVGFAELALTAEQVLTANL
ncbi:MAG: Uma2 family endonuclease, partial [Cyanobacteria bacterium J06588_5]